MHHVPSASTLLLRFAFAGAALATACGAGGSATVSHDRVVTGTPGAPGQSGQRIDTGPQCAGTAIENATATVSIDLGDLSAAHRSLTLRVGDTLFLGSNGCGDYAVPAASSVRPVLEEVHRTVATTPGAEPRLDVLYRAKEKGSETLQVSCTGTCPAALVTVDVTVSG